MTFSLVLLAWLAALAYVPFHFRKTKEMRSLLLGFAVVWYAVATATVPDQDEWLGADGDSDWAEKGLVTGFISLFVAIIVVVAVAGYTLYLAW